MASDESIPTVIDGMPVVLFSRIDDRHEPTENCTHIVAGSIQGPAWGVAICDAGKDGYYLFRCESDWMPVTDTWHESIERARDQAEFEYFNLQETWQSPPS